MKFFDRFRSPKITRPPTAAEIFAERERDRTKQERDHRMKWFSQTSTVDEVDAALQDVLAANPANREELAEVEAKFRDALDDKALNHMLQIGSTLLNAGNLWRAYNEGPHLRFVYKPLLIQQYDGSLELLKFVSDGDDPALVVAAYLAADAIRERLLAFQDADLQDYLMVSGYYFQRWIITYECGLPTVKLRPEAVGKYQPPESLSSGNLH